MKTYPAGYHLFRSSGRNPPVGRTPRNGPDGPSDRPSWAPRTLPRAGLLKFLSATPISRLSIFPRSLSPAAMDHYAADENYFTDEGLQKSHETLVQKLNERKQQHLEEKRRRRAQRKAAKRVAQRRRGQRRRTVLIVTAVTLVGLVGGWVLSLFVF